MRVCPHPLEKKPATPSGPLVFSSEIGHLKSICVDNSCHFRWTDSSDPRNKLSRHLQPIRIDSASQRTSPHQSIQNQNRRHQIQYAPISRGRQLRAIYRIFAHSGPNHQQYTGDIQLSRRAFDKNTTVTSPRLYNPFSIALRMGGGHSPCFWCEWGASPLVQKARLSKG